MSLTAILILGAVLGIAWRLVRLAVGVALLIALIAAIANYRLAPDPAQPPAAGASTARPVSHLPGRLRGLIPRAAGSFSDRTIDGLQIYVPVRQAVG